MPATYEKLGIRFDYPENWSVDEEEAQQTRSSVSVYSPGGAFWSIAIHPRSADPQELTFAALKAMREVYNELDAEPRQGSIAGNDSQGFEMNFYCLDLTNTAVVESFRAEEATYVVFWQAEDREYERLGPVFRAITRSLTL